MRSPGEILKRALAERLAPHGAVSEFCRNTKFSRVAVDNWLYGRSTPNLDNLPAIAKGLGIPIEQLVSERRSLPADVQAVVDALMTLNEAQRALVVGPFTEAIREFHEINAGERASPITGKKQKQK